MIIRRTLIPLLMSSCIGVMVIYTRTPRRDDETLEKMHRLRGPLVADEAKLVELVRSTYLDPPSNLPYNLSTNPYYKQQSRLGGWQYIYWHLEQIFSKQKNGFFVEAGALDGEYLSNTLWLEEKLQWTGLLIEPNRESYRHLLGKHRKAWSSNTCLSTEAYPKETVLVNLNLQSQYMDAAWNHKGSSHELGVNLEGANKFTGFFMMNDKSYSVVQCFPLSTYLLALNVSTIDLLSLDIQGAEKHVLRAFPWHGFDIRVIVLELSEEVHDSDFERFLDSKGYVMLTKVNVGTVDNHIFIKGDELSQMSLKVYKVFLN